jgi:hypothetical protein
MRPAPTIEKMASGNLSLFITEEVSWETFPEEAAKFMVLTNGTVLKKIDTPVERSWIVLINWRPFWLTYDDSPFGMSLDSMLGICNPVVRRLYGQITQQQPHNNSFKRTAAPKVE